MYTSAIEIRRRTQGRKPQTEEKKGRKSPKGTHPPPSCFTAETNLLVHYVSQHGLVSYLKQITENNKRGEKQTSTRHQMENAATTCHGSQALSFLTQGWKGAIQN